MGTITGAKIAHFADAEEVVEHVADSQEYYAQDNDPSRHESPPYESLVCLRWETAPARESSAFRADESGRLEFLYSPSIA